MPRIAAATLREHNEQVLAALVDAAEQLLRDDPSTPLTAGAVATRAGIARNSIYRHVGSVDELRQRVLARHVPAWGQAVAEALDHVDDPAGRVRAWVQTNLDQAAVAGHAWLAAVAAQGAGGGPSAAEHAHGGLEVPLREAWAQVCEDGRAPLFTDLTRSLVNAGMRRAEAGDDHQVVAAAVLRGVDALLEAAGDGPQASRPTAQRPCPPDA